jgi:hypothetical protein
MITMLLGGLWHGAAWLFIIWGAWHGIMLVAFHALKARGWVASNATAVGRWFNRQLMFLGVVIGWVFFRAADIRIAGEDLSLKYGFRSITPALRMLRQMFNPMAAAPHLAHHRSSVPSGLLYAIIFGWIWCNFLPNSFEIAYGLKLRRWHAVTAGAVMALCLLHFGLRMDFLYFRF